MTQTEHFECACHSKEHLLAFEYFPEHQEVYTHIQLNHYLPWYQRIVVAFKFVFTLKHNGRSDWDVWMLHHSDIQRLKELFNSLK